MPGDVLEIIIEEGIYIYVKDLNIIKKIARLVKKYFNIWEDNDLIK